jgi:transporter family-2 protein
VSEQAKPPTTTSVGYALAVVAGVITSIQSRVNGGLADFLGSGTSAALVNFIVGLIIIATLVASVPRSRAGVVAVLRALRNGTLPWWALIGGVFGAFFIAIQSTSVPVIGVALFSVALVSGQTVSSLLVDRLGIGTHRGVPITTARIIGAVGAALAVLIAVSDRWSDQAGGFWLLIVLSFLAGVLVAMQQAVNGRVSMTARSAPAATLGNFLVGALTLTVVVAASGAFTGSASPINASGPAWAYLGGILGVTFIGISAFTVPILGVLSFALTVIAAQLAGAIVLDLIWPATTQPITPPVIAGALLAALAAFIGRRRAKTG